MKLSMSMLRWYLRKYNPESFIAEDRADISGMRFLVDETIQLSPGYVYISAAKNFFYGDAYQDACLMASGHSRLIFRGCDSEELLNALLGAFDYFRDWENRLLQAAARHAPLQEMLEIAAEVIENSISAGAGDTAWASVENPVHKEDPYWSSIDSSGKLPAPVTADPYIDYETGHVIRDLSETPRLVRNVYPQSDPVLMLYLYDNGEPVGTLAIRQDNPALTEMNRQLCPLLAGYFSNAAEFTGETAQSRAGAALLRDLLAGNPVSPALLETFAARRMAPPYRLLIFRHETRGDILATTGFLEILQRAEPRCIPLEFEDSVLALATARDCGLLLAGLEQNFGLTHHLVGLSMPILELTELPVGYKQALFALEQLHGQAGISRCEDHAFSYLIGALRAIPPVEELLHPAIAILAQYDRKTGSTLEETLYTYLRYDRNLILAAQSLNIHRNTLKYRIKRIRELTGIDIDDRDNMDYLMLSLRIRRR